METVLSTLITVLRYVLGPAIRWLKRLALDPDTETFKRQLPDIITLKVRITGTLYVENMWGMEIPFGEQYADSKFALHYDSLVANLDLLRIPYPKGDAKLNRWHTFLTHLEHHCRAGNLKGARRIMEREQ